MKCLLDQKGYMLYVRVRVRRDSPRLFEKIRVILVADHIKLDRVFMKHVASLDAVDEVVTDVNLPDEACQALLDRGPRLHVASVGHMPAGKEARLTG